MNNFDRIKAMDIDEFAKYLDDITACDFCRETLHKRKVDNDCENYCNFKRIPAIKRYLLKEVR